MRRGTLLTILGLIVIGIGWYLFRPERLFIDNSVAEAFIVPKSSVVLLEGRFHDVAHEGSGLATIHQLPDGKRVLRITQFKVLNGPDLFVYLVASDDAYDAKRVKQAGFVSLGPLKGNIGDQTYDIPSNFDMTKYRSVSIWCRRFGVNFATAPMRPQQ